MDVFDKLPAIVDELVRSFDSTPAVGNLYFGITQYSFWLYLSCILLLALMAVFVKAQARSFAPKGKFVNAVELLVEFVRDDLCIGILGQEKWRKHFPYIATLFFFVLINDIVGIVPGMHPGTGSIGTTAALALVSFLYFIGMGVKAKGGWGYIKSLAPEGLPLPMALLVGLIEFFSTLLRPLTLAIRLFCNMYAGHIVMGTFAILASLFFQPLLTAVSPQHAAGALASIAWVLVLIVIYLVELLVAAIQAYVFTLLTAVYINTAEEGD